MSNLSDVSSSNLPSSDEDERTNRQQLKMDILDIPATKRFLPLVQEPCTDWYRSTKDEKEFEDEVADLNEAELTQRLRWAKLISVRLDRALEYVQAQHKSEWLAKEELLSQILAKEIPDSSSGAPYTLEPEA